ncbi:OsmC family protein [Kocuria sp. M1R5S2]|uniref:OsmC family protein n=1 Tax=Kocuria rhizosphaerae TaxID=3376285 RepID=UPI0037BC11F7
MSETPDPTPRSVELTRTATGRYTARNAAGAEIEFGREEGLLTPVELLLAAIAGCSAIDVDVATSRSSEPSEFRVAATGRKVVEQNGANRMDDLHLSFRLSFPDDAGGRKAAGMVERLVALSHDKYCTVSRTVEHGVPVGHDVTVGVDGEADGEAGGAAEGAADGAR